MTRKYDYWHEVTEVSKDYAKTHKNIKVGTQITHSYPKRDEWVSIINKNGKMWNNAYRLKYLKRLPVDLSYKEINKQLRNSKGSGNE